MKGLVAAILCTLGLGVITTVHAQSASEILSSVKAKASEYDELRNMLNSPDPSVRLATFVAMSKSTEIELRDMAFTEALSSSDLALRTAAFEKLMNSGIKQITLTPKEVSLSAIQGKPWASKFNPYKLTFHSARVSGSSSGLTFNGVGDSFPGSGLYADLSGLLLKWGGSGSQSCNGQIELKEGAQLEGFVSCGTSNNGTRIELTGYLR